MAVLTIRDVSRRSGLSEPTLRYYEEIGLIGPIARDESSGHRRYQTEDLDVLQALACMRATGVGIEDMRTYQANRGRGHEAAAEQWSNDLASYCTFCGGWEVRGLAGRPGGCRAGGFSVAGGSDILPWRAGAPGFAVGVAAA